MATDNSFNITFKVETYDVGDGEVRYFSNITIKFVHPMFIATSHLEVEDNNAVYWSEFVEAMENGRHFEYVSDDEDAEEDLYTGGGIVKIRNSKRREAFSNTEIIVRCKEFLPIAVAIRDKLARNGHQI